EDVDEEAPARRDDDEARPGHPDRGAVAQPAPDERQDADQAGDEADRPLAPIEAADGVDVGGLPGQQFGVVDHGCSRSRTMPTMNQIWAARPVTTAISAPQLSQSSP